MPTVSVIIPTKNRAADLEVVIEDLLQQSTLPTELIVVDQSARPSYKKSVPISLNYIHNPELSGAATARNAGMDVVHGDILLFLDDDVILEKCFIEQIVAAFQPGITGVSGIITNYKRPALLRRLWEWVFVRAPFPDDRKRIYWNAAKLIDADPIPIRKMTGELMSFRAEAVRALRFDANLTGRSPGEDIDLCASLPEGSVLVMAPRARLVHKRSPAGREPVYWVALHAQASRYLRERHWKHGFRNHAAYAWLNTVYAASAVPSCMRKQSFDPWKRWREGARKGFALAHPNE